MFSFHGRISNLVQGFALSVKKDAIFRPLFFSTCHLVVTDESSYFLSEIVKLSQSSVTLCFLSEIKRKRCLAYCFYISGQPAD